MNENRTPQTLVPQEQELNESTAMLSMGHSASAARFSSLLAHLDEECSKVQKGQEFFLRAAVCWRLAHCRAPSWLQLHRHSCGLQLFSEERTMSKTILPSKKLFFQSCAGTCISQLPILRQIKIYLCLLSSTSNFSGLC